MASDVRLVWRSGRPCLNWRSTSFLWPDNLMYVDQYRNNPNSPINGRFIWHTCWISHNMSCHRWKLNLFGSSNVIPCVESCNSCCISADKAGYMFFLQYPLYSYQHETLKKTNHCLLFAFSSVLDCDNVTTRFCDV